MKRAKIGEEFRMQTGIVLRNLVDLVSALTYMRETEYNHHVTKEKNDFADWLERSLEEKELAQKLREAHSQKAMYALVLKKLHDETLAEDVGEEQFSKYHEEKADEYDKIIDRIDQRIKEWKEAIDPEIPPEFEKKLADIQDEMNTLRLDISEVRRSGKDTFFSQTLYQKLNPLIMFAKATRNMGDLTAVKRMIAEIRQELEREKQREEVNIKAEVTELVGPKEKPETASEMIERKRKENEEEKNKNNSDNQTKMKEDNQETEKPE